MDILIIHGYSYKLNSKIFLNSIINLLNNNSKFENKFNNDNKLNIFKFPYYELLETILEEDYNIGNYSTIDKYIYSYLYLNKTKLKKIKTFYKNYYLENIKEKIKNDLEIYTYSFGIYFLLDIIDILPKNYKIINISDPLYILDNFNVSKYKFNNINKDNIITYYSYYDIIANKPSMIFSNNIVCIEDINPILDYINYYTTFISSSITVHLYIYKIIFYILQYDNIYIIYINYFKKIIYYIFYLLKLINFNKGFIYIKKYIKSNLKYIFNVNIENSNILIIDNIFDINDDIINNNVRYIIIDNNIKKFIYNLDLYSKISNKIIYYNKYNFNYEYISKYTLIHLIYNIYKYSIVNLYNLNDIIFTFLYYKFYNYNIINYSKNLYFNLIKLHHNLNIEIITENLNNFDIYSILIYFIYLFIYSIQNNFEYIYPNINNHKNNLQIILKKNYFNIDNIIINKKVYIYILCILNNINDLDYIIKKINYYNFNNELNKVMFNVYILNNKLKQDLTKYNKKNYINFIKYIDNINDINNYKYNINDYTFYILSDNFVINTFINKKDKNICILNNSLNIFNNLINDSYFANNNIITINKFLLLITNIYELKK
jgi:hypothetical protein